MEIPKKFLEIERKFLLKALPDNLISNDWMSIEQHYVPGKTIKERLTEYTVYSHTAPSKGPFFFRTVKVSIGMTDLSRLEFDEEINSQEFFALLDGANKVLSKTRFKKDEWDIDQIHTAAQGTIYIAEIELPCEDALYTFPDWLAPYVICEVTNEEKYKSENLATNIDKEEEEQ